MHAMRKLMLILINAVLLIAGCHNDDAQGQMNNTEPIRTDMKKPLSPATQALFDALIGGEGSAARIEELLNNGADLTAQSYGSQPLHLALDKNATDVALLLIAKGAPVDTLGGGGEPPLVAALLRNNAVVVRALLDKSADANVADTFGMSALMAAVEAETADFVPMLLAAGARVDAIDKDKDTALNKAIYSGKWETATLLIQAGTELRRPEGAYLVHAAASDPRREQHQQKLAFLDLLLEKGVDINQALLKDEHYYARGATPLMAAAFAGDPDAVELLLVRGANINAQDANGNAALMYVSGETWSADDGSLIWSFDANEEKILRRLLAAGANTSLKNRYRKTAGDLSRDQGHTAALAILEASR